jgi:hypothetical protein
VSFFFFFLFSFFLFFSIELVTNVVPALDELRLKYLQDAFRQRTDLFRKIFDSTDLNRDGQVSRPELFAALRGDPDLRTTLTQGSLKDLTDLDLFKSIDSNRDGSISWEEFQSTLEGAIEKPLEKLTFSSRGTRAPDATQQQHPAAPAAAAAEKAAAGPASQKPSKAGAGAAAKKPAAGAPAGTASAPKPAKALSAKEVWRGKASATAIIYNKGGK